MIAVGGRPGIRERLEGMERDRKGHRLASRQKGRPVPILGLREAHGGVWEAGKEVQEA